MATEWDRQRGVGRTSTVYDRGDGLDQRVSTPPPPHISTSDFMKEVDPDPWDTTHLGTYIQRHDSIGPAKRMLQTEGEFSASFTRAQEQLGRKTNGNGSNGHGHEASMFRHAAEREEIPDKDALEGIIPDIIEPAVKGYERTLRMGCGVRSKDARKKAIVAQARLERLVFEAASVPENTPTILEEVGRFVNVFLPGERLFEALRGLKPGFSRVPTPRRQEIFRSISRPVR